MSNSTTIYVVRHGQSEDNIRVITKNSTQVIPYLSNAKGSSLTQKGEEQAKIIAEKFKNIHFDAVFSSNKQRAIKTAEIIVTGRNIPFRIVDSIFERRYGRVWINSPREERIKMEEALYELSDKEKFSYKFSEDGESAQEGIDRFIKFIKETVTTYQGKTVLVVNHGGIMRNFLAYIGWGKFEELPQGSVKNTGYFVMNTDGNKYTIIETDNIIKKLTGAEE